MRWFVLAGSLIAGAAMAHSGATGKVKERMDGMKAMGAAMKTVGPMAQGKSPYEAQAVRDAGRAIEAHAQKMVGLFPKGSDHKPTRALPDVWSNDAGFQAIADKLTQAASAMAANADDQGALADGFATVAKTCKDCHQVFRAPE
ncbi:MAG: c-type cytochrome [Pikeienuella sp.]